jgi:hypothetical protein
MRYDSRFVVWPVLLFSQYFSHHSRDDTYDDHSSAPADDDHATTSGNDSCSASNDDSCSTSDDYPATASTPDDNDDTSGAPARHDESKPAHDLDEYMQLLSSDLYLSRR